MKSSHKRVILVAVATVALVASALPQQASEATLKKALSRLNSALSGTRSEDDLWEINSLCNAALEELKLPDEFAAMAKELRTLYRKDQFSEATQIADLMTKMLPEKFSTDYPLSEDYLIEWRVFVGKLRAYSCDYKGAIREFETALKMTPLPSTTVLIAFGDPELTEEEMAKAPKESWINIFGSHAKNSATYGLARMYALTGRQADSLKMLDKAPSFLRNWCGNCYESSTQSDRVLRTVWAAASKGGQQSERALLSIAKGYYRPLPDRLNKGSGRGYILYAQLNATFMLGEYYLHQRKTNLAKLAYQTVALDSDSEIALMASSRLKQLAIK